MPKNIGKTLKERRVAAKISVKKISELLTQKGFKASESTIYSWENNNSQPTPGALLTMCTAYGIEDVLSTFGYDGYKEDGSIMLDLYESELIEKYRIIKNFSPKGKESVDYTLNREYELAKEISKKQSVKDNIITYSATPVAARNDHESEAGEQEKMKEDIAGLKRPE